MQKYRIYKYKNANFYKPYYIMTTFFFGLFWKDVVCCDGERREFRNFEDAEEWIMDLDKSSQLIKEITV